MLKYFEYTYLTIPYIIYTKQKIYINNAMAADHYRSARVKELDKLKPMFLRDETKHE